MTGSRRLCPILAVALTLPWLVACPPSAHQATAGFPALAPSAPGSLPHIGIRRLPGRPGLTTVTRDGDPAAAVAVAVATGLTPVANSALAAVLEHRLRQAGHDTVAHADGMSLRLVLTPPDADAVRGWVEAVRVAFGAPVNADGALRAAVARRLAALRRQPLDGPAMGPVVACTGQLGVLAAEVDLDVTTAAGLAQLERWRRAGLDVGRTAIAVVGPEAMGQAALESLEDSSAWPSTKASLPPIPSQDQHGAFLLPVGAPPGPALHLALYVPDAPAAASAVRRAGRHGSPLLAKLGALDPPWTVDQISATARPQGGCVGLRLHPDETTADGAEGLADAAAKASGVIRRELERELTAGADPHVVATEIAVATDPREAAQRAAWWSLSTPTGQDATQTQLTTAVGIPAPARDQEPPDLGEIGARYQDAQTRLAGRADGAGAERRLSVEHGQGQVWLLLASPCALLDEGPNEMGRAALTAFSSAAGATAATGVEVEPWITAEGVGLMAHGPLRNPAEAPAALARRVGDALGRAFANGVRDPLVFTRAKNGMIRRLQPHPNRYLESFARHALPNHPSWIAPLGALARHQAATHLPLLHSWRRLLRSPLRLAVIANADEHQAEVAATAVDRWLLDEARGESCPQQLQRRPPSAGPHHVEGSEHDPARVLMGTVAPQSADEDRLLAALTVEALAGSQGLLRRSLATADGSLAHSWSARVLGGQRVVSLLVEAAALPGKVEPVRERLAKLLAGLAERGLSPEDRQRALTAFERRRRERRMDPRERLGALWRGAPSSAAVTAPEPARWQQWLQAAWAPERLVVVTTAPGTTP